MAGGVFSRWADSFIVGWIFDSVEMLKENYENRRGVDTFEAQQQGYQEDYEENLNKIETETNAKLNLGGENDKAKIEFSDKPIGVFDFSLASQLLYRVHEFYSEELKYDEPFLFKEYETPSGVVPNYFALKEIIGSDTIFFYLNPSTGKKYILDRRQKGLTQVLLDDPYINTTVIGGMIVPEKPVKGVVFSSRTKKPYVKYKKRGGKVKYVEIYSLFYFSKMGNDFAKSVRHLPVVMVCEYLEKMGTLTKFYLTRFMQQTIASSENPRQFDVSTGLELPLYENVTRIGRRSFDDKLVLQPMCVKDYGEELNKAFVYGASGNRKDLYERTYYGMSDAELVNNQEDPYGYPDWDENDYQEGFERYRQKYIQYTQKGIWKAKEVTAQGLIYFHDLFLNNRWEMYFDRIWEATRGKYSNFDNDWPNANGIDLQPFVISYSPENTKWFELWVTISANTIRHKLDIFNSNNPRKTFQLVFKDLQEIIEEIDLLISSETNISLKTRFEDWRDGVLDYYELNNPKSYCENRINEMTFYAKGGCFETPEDDMKKRNAEATRLKNELKKM